MQIKRVDIIGFKSFVDKVSLDFQQRITGVVGPNGCGKSNIVDAIRWAMGEQNARNLRGRNMEDIIFGGSESRRAHGMAEVSIIFDNKAKICPEAYCEYAEIMITRRLFRNGDSEYLINKTPCRLLDITELFMDTGVGARAYSIIEQGKVGMLISARPEERRAVIEEAAGVTKFKSRKKSAQRKMDATRQNLLRLGDIISEVRRQSGSLKRQAQQAEKYRELRGEAKRIEICMAGNRYRVMSEELQQLDADLLEQSKTLTTGELELERGDLALEEKRLAQLETEGELNRKQQQDYALGGEGQRVENEIILAGRQAEQLVEQSGEMATEGAQIAARLQDVDREVLDLKMLERRLSDDFAGAQEVVALQQETLQMRLGQEQLLATQLSDLRQRQMEVLSDAARLGHRQQEIARLLQTHQVRQERNQRDSLLLGEELALGEEALSTLLAQQRELAAQTAAGLEERALSTERILQVKGELLELETERMQQQKRLDRQGSRLESLEELERNREGYTSGAQTLLSAAGRSNPQLVADLLQVEPAYESLVELALGERLQALPLAQTAEAHELFAVLKKAGTRATLISAQLGSIDVSADYGEPLLAFVHPREELRTLVENLLAGCYLVDHVLNYADQSLSPGVLLVDSDGLCLGWRGDISGGAMTATGSGLLRKKREIQELRTELQVQGVLVENLQLRVDDLVLTRQEFEQQLAGCDERQHQYEFQKLEQGKDLDRLESEQQHRAERLELLSFDADQMAEEHQSLVGEQRQISLKTDETAGEKLQAEMERLQERLREEREGVTAVREELTVLKVRLAEFRQQAENRRQKQQSLIASRSEYQQRAEQLAARRQYGGKRVQELKEREGLLRVELDLLLQRREETQILVAQVRERYEIERAALEVQRENVRRRRGEVEQLRQRVADQRLRHKELSVEIGHLLETVAEKFDIELSAHQVAEADAAELGRLQVKLQHLLQKISGLGEVNLTAIEEFHELEERYAFLGRQRDDLNRSLDDLHKAITKINRTTRKRFKETFDQVNEKFKLVFPRLFRGGQAELRLTDEEDLLETGIEIIVQPPGKKLQNVNLLSGGEKALTAVAIIFSLFLIKPTPFCMLDEVDAPLDDANIDRFAEMVAEMADNSQFIIITHSKRTMATADIMHGITMQEPGVSKLVSVRVNDYASELAGPLS